MKTILLATNFFESSKEAARYGYALAVAIKARVVIVNAMILTTEIPEPGFVYFPDEEVGGLLQDHETKMQLFKAELEKKVMSVTYRPDVVCINEIGRLTEVIKSATVAHKADMIVIGIHEGGALTRFLIGNHAEQLIDANIGPLLIIKPDTVFRPLKKIAFATEFKNPEQDLKAIYQLIAFARLLNAEILLAHVSDKNENTGNLQKTMQEYLVELSNKADYPHIYYRFISNSNIDDGLAWLCEHGQIDMLAMVHRSRNLLSELFGNSHTKNMNNVLDLPLMVFSSNRD